MPRALALLLASLSGLAAEDIRFNRDIRPILSENCFYCHGQDPKHREAGLRLDVREEAVKANDGVTAIVPGKPEQSEILKRLLSHDADEQMPPPESNRKVSAAQIELIRRWIAQGAPYEKHWAFVPPTKAPVPKVADLAWVRQPFDRFVLAKLEAEKLKPSHEARPAAWLRRASFDLTGLPPTPAEIAAFEQDVGLRGDLAYLTAAQRLLDSPRFGERLAQEWLDVARYADTHGFNNDSARSMWRWRDWVIASFNENKRFDRFVTEQLAGDLLPDPTPDQRLATAFNRNHVINSEGGIIDEEYRVEYVADRVRTTSTALLGLTTECARCHDHKYDPITQKDYYRMFAFFNNVHEYGEDGRVANAVPLLVTPTAEQETKLREMERRLRAIDIALQASPTPEGLLPDLDTRLQTENAKLAPKTPKPAKPNEARVLAKEADVDPKRGTTLSVWFKAKAVSPDAPIISALDRSGNPAGVGYGNGRELRLVGDEVEWAASQRYPAYATIVRTVGAKIRPGAWHQVAVHIRGKEDAATIAIFVDGEEVPTQIRHDGVAGTPAKRDWLLGADGKAKPFDREVGGFQTYPSVLTPAQVRHAY